MISRRLLTSLGAALVALSLIPAADALGDDGNVWLLIAGIALAGFGATCLVWGVEVGTLPLGWAGLFTTLGLLAASVYGAVV